jgi:hypothetical protein
MQSRSRRWLFWLSLCACGATEGPLLVQRSAPDAGAPLMKKSLQYQITGALDTDVDADWFVVDLFATSAAQVATLHGAGRVVMAYVSAGSLEPWRDDVAALPEAAVGEPLASYPDEAWLDTRSDAVRELLAGRLDRARAKGFDGVFASTLGAYQADSGFPLSRDDELDFLEFLLREAHARGLQIGLSGDFALALPLSFDFTIAMGCVAQDTCAELAPWAERVPSFDLELSGDPAAVCDEAASYGIAVTFKRASYDAFRSVCP